MKKYLVSAMATGLIMAGVATGVARAEGETPPPPDRTVQWCSPGFWKNNPNAWPVEVKPWYGYWGNPAWSFEFVFANPKITARVGAYEGAADILSKLHPLVDWRPGDPRVGNSCPLAADASFKNK